MSTDVFNFDSPPLCGLLILSYDTDTQLPGVEFVRGFISFLFFFSLERILFSELTNEKLMFSARARNTKSRFPAKLHQCTFILTCLNSGIWLHQHVHVIVLNKIPAFMICSLGTGVKLALKEFYSDVRQSWNWVTNDKNLNAGITLLFSRTCCGTRNFS